MSIEMTEKSLIDLREGVRQGQKLPDADKRVTNDPMEATYVAIMSGNSVSRQVQRTSAVRQAVG